MDLASWILYPGGWVGLLPLFLQTPQIPALTFFRRAAASNASGWSRQPLHFSKLDFLGGWGWRVVGIELPRTGLRHIGGLELQDFDDAAAAAGDLDADSVAGPYRTVWLAAVAVDLDPTAQARGLRLRAGLEDTGHVKPDIEPD